MPITITYPLAFLIAIVVAGASFLGYEHVLDGQTIGTLFGAIVTGATVGHFGGKGSE
jgi:hypothetical protein